MRNNPKQLQINYLGIKDPETPEEIQFEIMGLETAISEAKYKIAQLKQGLSLANLISKGKQDDNHTSISSSEE